MSSGSGDGDVGVINFVGASAPEPQSLFLSFSIRFKNLPPFLQLVVLLQGSPVLSEARSYLGLVPAT